ncbi:diacylglycerol kinase family lipid kinase [Kineosporia sp. J2-2]|uniref:Diacylglycerol kinase family lipid kinase n=1 Tax=Kineosporia corallincola TaxID=2835133 RepID=A0ABS5TJF0_9ACTN|nr:diacylglycerol kinase family protein [Kineosporia corallincola]MBT0771145.1 diacylglycerol kinase family lipid kinase [Kineosporia corallincola]
MSISSDVWNIVLVVALVLAVVVLLVLVATRRRLLFRGRTSEVLDDTGEAPQAAVVVHGVKVDDHDARRRQIEVLSGRLGWRAPVWLETTAQDPGRGQTRKAVADGASVVIAFGGDGTTRAVAESLARTGVPMGLLPAGTGNLLARNLGIPPNRLESSLHIALTGRNRTIDIGHVELADTLDSPPRKESFLVMSGLGFDAEVMATTAPELKKKIGWVAYVVAGASRLRGRRTPVTMQVDDGPVQQRKIRAVVVGNVGMLQGGIQLMPGALPDDGWLDVVVVSPRGMTGWLPVVGAILTRRDHTTVEHFRCRTIEIHADRPMFAQLDGDPTGTAQTLKARVDPLALVVRVPG